jgi:hypothetical protein
MAMKVRVELLASLDAQTRIYHGVIRVLTAKNTSQISDYTINAAG